MKEELMLSPNAQNLGQLEYDDIQMAIQQLSSLSQNQFEEIKNEKWYNRLWDMVTFSQKGKKRLAEQIGSVAQAQQILVEMLLRLSEQDRYISELVIRNASYIERMQHDNIYLLSEINLLKDKIRDINVKVKFDANIRDLNDEEKRALSGCLNNLAELNNSPTNRQKEYLNTILNYVDDNTRMENPFAALEDFDNKIKGKILACCMEYMFLEDTNSDVFNKYQDFIDEFDCGKKTISDIQDQVVSIYHARGEQGFIDRYKYLEMRRSPLFYIDFDEENSQEDNYNEVNKIGSPELKYHDYDEIDNQRYTNAKTNVSYTRKHWLPGEICFICNAKNPNRYLQISSNGTVVVGVNNNEDNQKWVIEQLDYNLYRIKNIGTSLYLSLKSNRWGTPIEAKPWDGDRKQKWKIEERDGLNSFVSATSIALGSMIGVTELSDQVLNGTDKIGHGTDFKGAQWIVMCEELR